MKLVEVEEERGKCMSAKIVSGFRSFFDDESGQSTTEYILILSVVVMIAMKFKQVFGDKLTHIIDAVGGNIDQSVSNGQ